MSSVIHSIFMLMSAMRPFIAWRMFLHWSISSGILTFPKRNIAAIVATHPKAVESSPRIGWLNPMLALRALKGWMMVKTMPNGKSRVTQPTFTTTNRMNCRHPED
jgi:hypothetical protein